MGVVTIVKLALQLINMLVSRANAERERGLGRSEAVAAALEGAMGSIRTARAVEAETEATHRADATDGAFDPDFRRD